MQTWPDIIAHYNMVGQPTIRYGSWVENIDALAAVRKYKPQVVVASWVTHWIDPDLPFPEGGGNMYGVKEDKLLDLVDTYVMIGNLRAHHYKPILKRPHEELKFDFVKSRALNPELDRIFIWKGKGGQ